MPRVKRASKQKRTSKAGAVMALGAAGVGLSLVGSASASTTPTFDLPQSNNSSPNHRFVLSEEEMTDVSLAEARAMTKCEIFRSRELRWRIAGS